MSDDRPSGTKGPDLQLSLPFAESSDSSKESAKKKREAAKPDSKGSAKPVSSPVSKPPVPHGAKATFGSAAPAKGTVTVYQPTEKKGSSQKASGGSYKFSGQNVPVSGAGAKRSSVGKEPSSNISVTGGGPGAKRGSGSKGVPGAGGDLGGGGKPAPKTGKAVTARHAADAPAAKEFMEDAPVFSEGAESVDFRSSSSRTAGAGSPDRRSAAGQDFRRSQGISDLRKRPAREEMLEQIKRRQGPSSTRSRDVDPDVPLHAGPGPNVENRKRTSSRGTAARERTSSASRGNKRTPATRRVQKTSARTNKRVDALLLIVVILVVVLFITLIVVFVRTGKRAERRVPSIAGQAMSSGAMSATTALASMPDRSATLGDDQTVLVEIRAGMSAGEVCQMLASRGVVADAKALLAYLAAQGLDRGIRQGSLLLRRGMDNASCAAAITGKGDASMVDATVFAGYTLEDVDRMLATRGYADPGDFVKAARVLANGFDLPFAEGWFLAGTYRISRDDGSRDLAVAMYRAMLDALRPMLGDIAALDRSVADVLIVASMIQRETNNAEEMPLIAGIIYKRLDEDIALGIDATTRYETGNWNDPIDPVDLETQTPYNTRRKKGLPPSGIGCPGLDALRAAVYPKESPWYYYLHGTDGVIHFARTYEDHQRNITQWR